MVLTAILPWKEGTHRRDSNGEASAIRNPEGKGETIPFEMDVHVPCKVAGTTKDGSKWEGETSTLSIGSFGAHLQLPVDAELEGDIDLTFKVPPPLATLFVRKKFRANAEVKPSGAAGSNMATNGRKVVCIVFAEPLYFSLNGPKGRA